jgi:hypothetical protein
MLKWDPPQVVGKAGGAKARAAAAAGSLTVEELLDAVVAPRTSPTNDGGMFLQRISSTPATRTDVTRLQEALDQQLLQKQARETGICPVRDALYREAFGAWRAAGGRLPPRAPGANARLDPQPPPLRAPLLHSSPRL